VGEEVVDVAAVDCELGVSVAVVAMEGQKCSTMVNLFTCMLESVNSDHSGIVSYTFPLEVYGKISPTRSVVTLMQFCKIMNTSAIRQNTSVFSYGRQNAMLWQWKVNALYYIIDE